MTPGERLPFVPETRILMGPGPSDVSASVRSAMQGPVLGHLDPQYLALLDDLAADLRLVFGTQNACTLAVPGTGTSGMEACLVNLLEPGDRAVVGACGYFGARLADIAERCGAEVTRVDAEWGEPLSDTLMVETIYRVRPRVVAFVHAETSTGVRQEVPTIAAAAREVGAYVVLDCVTSLGGIAVEVDAWGVDAAYSCTQKCLGAPPGLAPVTISERAFEAVRKRSRRVGSFYLDLTLLASYWSSDRVYHHTSSSSLSYALAEALRGVFTEGLDARVQRHLRNHRALVAGLEAMGLALLTAPEHRLPTLHTVRIPEGVDDLAVRRELLRTHSIEIGGGLGPLKGKIWRVGLMGASSTSGHVLLFLKALEQVLHGQGARTTPEGVRAAIQCFREQGVDA